MSARYKLLVTVLVFLLVGLTFGCASTPPFRDRTGRVLPDSVAEFAWLDVNGTRQSILVRGRRRDNPLIVVLHGGPGASETPFFRIYNGELEERLTVIYWDQRGAGRSYRPDIPAATMRIEQFVDDLDILVDYLRARFKQRRVILLGHSWGSALGLLYTQQHPQKVAAYIGTGQISSVPEAELEGYRYAFRQARTRNEQDALSELHAIGDPPHDTNEMLVSRKWVNGFGGSFHRERSHVALAIEALGQPEATIVDLYRFWRGNSFSLATMWPELRTLDLARRIPCVEVPVTFLLGRHDWQVPSTVAARYWKELKAPAKRLVWFERSAHNVPFEQPAEFNSEVIKAAEAAEYANGADFKCPPMREVVQ